MTRTDLSFELRADDLTALWGEACVPGFVFVQIPVANSWIEVGARENGRDQPTCDTGGANWLEAVCDSFGEMFLGLGVVLGLAELGSWGTLITNRGIND